ncbi:MAG: ATP-binding cassette domain-containing protein [Bacteroidota bacterium]
MIEVQGLTKNYGPERAVDNLSFSVNPGEVLGFLGPNGAGKSTTMKVLTCYLPPSEGTIKVDGLDVRTDSLAIRQRIGYLPESTPLYQDMATYDYLGFAADVRGVAKADKTRRIAAMTDVCGLGDVLGKPIHALSKGYKQRVGLAQAMIHDPQILVLDEPTSGLDPNQIVEIRDLIRSLGEEKTVILSTHILSEVQASCDRVLIINKGRIVADGTPDDLMASATGGQRIRFGVQQGAANVGDTLAGWGHVTIQDQQIDGDTVLYTLLSDAPDDLRPALFRFAVEHGWTLTELHRDQVNLEDVFRQLTTA